MPATYSAIATVKQPEKMNMSEIKNVEHDVEAKIHAILHELETKLQGIFGSHPKIAESVAAAKEQASAAVSANPTQSAGTEALAKITQPTGAEGALSSGAPNVAAQSAQTSSDST
jgi:hypothetical protein